MKHHEAPVMNYSGGVRPGGVPSWIEFLYDDSGYANLSGLGMPNASWGQHDMQKARLANKPEKIIAIILGIIGILANLFSLVAIMRVRGHLTANLRLIISLCISDVMMSVAMLLFIGHAEVEIMLGFTSGTKHTCFFVFARNFRHTANIISLLNLVGLALDHYFAIIRPLDHPLLLGRGRANAMIVAFWAIAILCGFSDFYIPFPKYSFCKPSTNLCEAAFCNQFTGEYIVFGIALISFILMSSLYTRIYIEILRYQVFHNQHRANVRRNRRGLITTFFIVLTFLICWLPYSLFEVIVIIDTAIHPFKYLTYHQTTARIDFYLFDVLLLNSICDPIIYAMRMREVQYGYRNTVEACLAHKLLLRTRWRRSMDTRSSSRTSHAVPLTSFTNGNKSIHETPTFVWKITDNSHLYKIQSAVDYSEKNLYYGQ